MSVISSNVSVAAVTCPITNVLNRPGVAGAVLQTPSPLINYLLTRAFPPNLQNIITPEP